MGDMRTRYVESQVLRAGDLRAEQSYLLAQRRRHNIGHHGWGIVEGLRILVSQIGFSVTAGMAIDGYGRELVVPSPVALPPDIFERLGSDAVDVWLLYRRVALAEEQRGRWDCGPGKHSRWREEAGFRLDATDWDTDIDPRRPPEVPGDGADPEHYLTPPDDPDCAWPVYLGRVRADRSIDGSKRPYVRLIGGTVRTPSGQAYMLLGGRSAGDRGRFVVGVSDKDDAFVDRLHVDRSGDTTLRGDVELSGATGDPSDLCIAAAEPVQVLEPGSPAPYDCASRSAGSATVGQAWGVGFGSMASPPQEASPWHVYRTVVRKEGAERHELRLEIAHPGEDGNPTRHRLAIGKDATPESGTASFVPGLSVSADGTVTVHGELIVEGQLVEGLIRADPDDPRFAGALTERWLQGMGCAGKASYAALSARIEAAESSILNQHLEYTVVITNTGTSEVTDVSAYENLTLNDETVRKEQLPGIPHALAAGDSHSAVRQFTPHDTGTLSVAITVVGLGPAGNPLQTSALRKISIQRSLG
jgi:hypothetical protein